MSPQCHMHSSLSSAAPWRTDGCMAPIFTLEDKSPETEAGCLSLLPVCKEEVSAQQEERDSSLVQVKPEPLQIKEEQEEMSPSLIQVKPEPLQIKEEQEEMSPSLIQVKLEPQQIKEDQQDELLQRPEEAAGSTLTLVAMRSEDDDSENRDTEPLASTSTEHVKTQAVERLLMTSVAHSKQQCQHNFKMEKENSVKSLLKTPFERRILPDKLKIKELGPDRPEVNITQKSKDRGREYTRSFSKDWYNKKAWLTACSESNALYCFPCLLFQSAGSDPAWINFGVTDLSHLQQKATKHEQTSSHMDNAVKLAMFGKVNIASQLHEGYRLGIRKHNEEVDKNRHILSKIIDCVKFCGAFELALHGHDESEDSANPGVFRGLVNFVASLDAVLQEHLQAATVFKGTSKTVQNELLNCMQNVLRDRIREEIRNADFVSIQADETIDVSTQTQLAIVYRYIDRAHVVQERFYEFVPLPSATADSTKLLGSLFSILPGDDQRKKLIAQAYDGASVTRGATGGGVNKWVQDRYENAHYVHCYAHELNLVMQQVTSRIDNVRQFFSDLGGFSGFFSRSPKIISVLDRVVAHRLPGTSAVRWNFHSRTVNTVFEHRDDLMQCFETIRDSGEFDETTEREAGGFVRLLEDDKFTFYLELFHLIMPHVDILYNQLQKRNIDSVSIQRGIQQFTEKVKEIRNSIPALCGEHSSRVSQEPPGKKRRTMDPDELKRTATEVCDTILSHAQQRFSFTKHLISATLLQSANFPQYRRQFPEAALNTTMEAYPMLNKSKLKTELSLIYRNSEFKECSGAVALYQVLMENDLRDTFSETACDFVEDPHNDADDHS